MKYDNSTSFYDLRKSAVKIADKLAIEEASEQISMCCSSLNLYHTPDGLRISRYRCKNRFCPICNHVKSTTIATFLNQQYEKLSPNNHFISLTLTVRNVSLSDVKDTQKLLFKSYTNVVQNWRRHIGREVASLRSYEVTYNNSENTFHPHLHILLVFPKNISLNKLSTYDFGGVFARTLPASLISSSNIPITKFGKHFPTVKENSIYKCRPSVVWHCEPFNPTKSTIFEFSKYLTKFKELMKLSNSDFTYFYSINKGVPVHTFTGEWRGYKDKIELPQKNSIFVTPNDEIIQNANSVLIGSFHFSTLFIHRHVNVPNISCLDSIFEFNPFNGKYKYQDIKEKFFVDIYKILFGREVN